MQEPEVRDVTVVGLGRMGHGIAQSFAAAGCTVGCHDDREANRRSLHERVEANLRTAAASGLGDAEEIDAILTRLRIFDTEHEALEGAGFVTEAVREDMAAKQAFFQRAEDAVADHAILATNTSSLRIGPMTAHLRRRDRVVVTHWFNPPHLVPVVEVVPAETTSEPTMRATCGLLRRIGKLAVRLKRDVPGFVVNRVQVAMIREVWSLLQDDVASPQDIDAAIRGSMGFRLAACGPLQINDFGGLDIWKRVYESLAPQIESGTALPQLIRDRVERGDLGVHAGRGVYDYTPESARAETAERDRRLLALTGLLYGGLFQADDSHG